MPRAIDCWVNTSIGDVVPPELVHFMNTRGKHKILFASDHPVLDFARCIREAEELPLRDGVLDRFLCENANLLFFQKGTS